MSYLVVPSRSHKRATHYRVPSGEPVRIIGLGSIAHQLGANAEVVQSLNGFEASQDTPPPVPVPQSVSAAQLRAAMIQRGLAATDNSLSTLIENAIADRWPAGTRRQIAIALWRHSPSFSRAGELAATLRSAGRTDGFIDELFREAAAFDGRPIKP